MADTNTPVYNFTQPEVGASRNTWGTKLNANWASIDDLLARNKGLLTSVAGTNTITATLTGVNLTAGLSLGDTFQLTPVNDVTGPTTLNVNSGGAKNIYFNGSPLAGGELKANVPALVRYNGTQYDIIARGDAASLGAANQTFTGNMIVQGNLSSQGNTTVGNASGDTLTINPNTVTYPNAVDVQISATTHQRLTSSGFTKLTNTGGFVGGSSGYHEAYSTLNDDAIICYSDNTSSNACGLRSNLAAASSGKLFRGLLGGVEQIRIESDGDIFNTNGTYGTISDPRLKNIIGAKSSTWDKCKSYGWIEYELKSNPGKKLLGLNADEVEKISPGMVQVRDQINGLINVKSVKYSIIGMEYFVAFQEAQKRIEDLEKRLAALEQK